MTKVKENKVLATAKASKLEKKSICDKLAFIPMVIILSIIPLIMRLKVQIATGADTSYALGSNFVDVYSYWKSIIILSMVVVMIVAVFFFFKKRELKISKAVKIGVSSLLVFAVVSLMSAIISPHQSLVWWGQYGQRQGFITIACYVVICLYSLHFYKENRDYKYILIPLAFLVIVEGGIIIGHFMGKNIMLTDFAKWIIIPAEYIDENTIKVSSGLKAAGTLFNPNYVGSFVALLAPIFYAVAMKVKSLKYKMGSMVLAIVLMISLIASGSRAGFVGVGISVCVGIILLGNFLMEKPKYLVKALIIMIVIVGGLNLVTNGVVVERISSLMKDIRSIFIYNGNDILQDSPIKEMYLEENALVIEFQDDKKLVITIDDKNEIVLKDEDIREIGYSVKDSKYIVIDKDLPINIQLQIGNVKNEEGEGEKKGYMLEVEDEPLFVITTHAKDLIFLDKYGNPIKVETSEAIGFKGRENVGSNRGYIWSRSLPIMRDNLIFGVGPDAFIAEFPHGDMVVKNAVYGTTTIIVDKPHNLYLQIGINQGIIALLSFLVLNITYIVNSFRVYRKKMEYTFHDMFGIGIMLGIVGYLGAGMFNDSVVSVAPLYWCLLGVGFAVNYINSVDTLQEIDNKKRQG